MNDFLMALIALTVIVAICGCPLLIVWVCGQFIRGGLKTPGYFRCSPVEKSLRHQGYQVVAWGWTSNETSFSKDALQRIDQETCSCATTPSLLTWSKLDRLSGLGTIKYSCSKCGHVFGFIIELPNTSSICACNNYQGRFVIKSDFHTSILV